MYIDVIANLYGDVAPENIVLHDVCQGIVFLSVGTNQFLISPYFELPVTLLSTTTREPNLFDTFPPRQQRVEMMTKTVLISKARKFVGGWNDL